MDDIRSSWDSLSDEERRLFWVWFERQRTRIPTRQLDRVSFPPNLAGVYCILNLVNKKRYIGQSMDLNARIQSHRSALANGYHPALSLQKDYHKFGPSAFEVIVLEQASTLSELLELEAEWISKTKRSKLYNSDKEYGVARRRDLERRQRKNYVQLSLFDIGP